MSESIHKDLTPRRTPVQSRPYFSHSHVFHQQQSPHGYSGTGSVHAIQQAKSVQSEQADVIYGTNISTKHVYQILQRFITQFQLQSYNNNISQRIYQTQLSQLDLFQTYIFDIQAIHLKQFDLDIYYQFIYFPAEMIMCFDQVIKNLYEKMFINEEGMSPEEIIEKTNKRDRLMVSIKKLDQIKIMRSLTEWEINKLICFRGIVVRTSDIVPEMKRAVFKCIKCEEYIRIILENAKIQQPKSCVKCMAKSCYELVHNLCEFTDKQYIKFQQLPQYVPQGQTPHSVTVIAYDYNVEAVRPGDRVEVVGIYRAQSVKIQKRRNQLNSVYKTHLDLISYRLVDQNRFKGSYGSQSVAFNDNDKQQFMKMADNPKIIQLLVDSFAPSIHGNRDIKKGILAQLFGGTKKQILQSGRGRFRADINICLVGDPSTAKSQLLQQVFKIAPRGIYTSGRGSSAVGLTANVKKDPETKQFILQSGALVLSDQGICCIDQFDKMDVNNKTILLQGMQQQTISIAKAGIVCQLNCRTAIISAANPIHSRYNPKKSVIQNINLPPALLSRFDLIYIMLDQPNQKYDRQIAQHLLNLYSSYNSNEIVQQANENKKPAFFHKDILTKYITYAREYVSPVLSESAANRLVIAYSNMRKMGMSRKIISATPRQLQSLIRLSQAFAKMRLSNQVTQKEVQQAINLITIATQQAATDPTTGLIDMDVIVTGKTSASKQKVINIAQKLKQIVKANVSKYKKKTSFQSIFNQIEQLYWKNNQKVTEQDVIDAMNLVVSEGIIVMFGADKNKPFFKIAKDTS